MKEFLESNRRIENLKIIDNIAYFEYDELKSKIIIDNEKMNLEIYYNSIYCDLDIIKDESGFFLNELYQLNYIFNYRFIDFNFDFIESNYFEKNIDELKIELNNYNSKYNK